MLSEIFGLLSSVETTGKGIDKKFRVNLNRNRIKSISAFSSNSIFYFPIIVSDDATPEELAMVCRLTERMNSSFVVACISLMPFHRIRADDRASIEEYLAQFHQNIGTNPGSNHAMQKALGFVSSLEETSAKLAESDDNVAQLQNHLYECWQRSKAENTDYLTIVAESVSVNDMYNVDAVDPRTKAIQEHYQGQMDELNTWGFIGEATEDMFDNIDIDALLDDEDLDEDDDDWDDENDIDESTSPKSNIKKVVTKVIKNHNAGSFIKSEYTINKNKNSVTVAYYSLHDFTNGHARESMKSGEAEELDRIIQDICSEIKKSLSDIAGNVDANGDWDEGFITVTLNQPITEGTVKQAIDNIKISLESVSENKILSCKNLTKLNTLEAKLKKLKNKYVKYLNRYKRKYKENQQKNSKSKLAIRFNGLKISNPKSFMKQYGEYIKIINKRLKLVEKRRTELHKRRGDTVTEKPDTKLEENAIIELTQMDLDAVAYCIRSIDESLNAADSNIFYIINEDEQGMQAANDYAWEKNEELERKNKAIIKQAQEQSNKAKKMEKKYRIEKMTADRLKQDLNKEKEKIAELRTRKSASGYTPPNDPYDDDDGEFAAQWQPNRPKSGINMARAARAGQRNFHTFNDKGPFTDMEMKKVNDAVPTFANASIGFVIDETEEVVTRDVLVGIKAYIHKAPARELISDIYNCIINKRKFLRFVKFITGEERSLSDLVFGIKELRTDALDARSGSGQWRSAFKRRRRWAKMSIPYLTKEYTPNGTIVMTMNEVDFIKAEYGIDIMSADHVRMIMDADFLLSFIILDQANEMVYVTYDGQGYAFQEYTYAMLEREAQQSDRAMRELYRSFSR